MARRKKKILLSEAIQEMETAVNQFDLSDAYLKRHRNLTREDCFACEGPYGITMVSCTFALQLAKKVLEKEGDQYVWFDSPG